LGHDSDKSKIDESFVVAWIFLMISYQTPLFDQPAKKARSKTKVTSTLEADWHRTPSREALNLHGMASSEKSAALRTARRQANLNYSRKQKRGLSLAHIETSM